MGNVGYITSRKWFNESKIEQDVRNILKKRFNNKIPLKLDNGFLVGFEYPFQVYFWVAGRNRIEFSAPKPRWGWWVRSVIENELAFLYNGWISDEGVAPDKWRGFKNKYPTFNSYLNQCADDIGDTLKDRNGYLDYIFKVEDRLTPQEVKATYNGNK